LASSVPQGASFPASPLRRFLGALCVPDFLASPSAAWGTRLPDQGRRDAKGMEACATEDARKACH
jgi:hypothetical protein